MTDTITLEKFPSQNTTDNDYIVDIKEKTCYRLESSEGSWVKIYLSPGYMSFHTETHHRLLRNKYLDYNFSWQLRNTYGNDTTTKLFSSFHLSEDGNYLNRY